VKKAKDFRRGDTGPSSHLPLYTRTTLQYLSSLDMSNRNIQS